MVVAIVPGMGCRHDVRRISAHIADVGGVTALRVDLGTKTVTVEGEVSVEEVAAAVVAAGYAVSRSST